MAIDGIDPLRDPLRRFDDPMFHSRRLHPIHVNKPQRVNNASDIEGASPAKRTMRVASVWSSAPNPVWQPRAGRPTNRVVNPLEPVYKLPSVKVPSIVSAPATRNPLRTDDIPGAKRLTTFEKLYGKSEEKVRDGVRRPLLVADIPGATSVKIKEPGRGRFNPLDVHDIAKMDSRIIDRSRRSLDPLNPRYKIYGRTLMTQNEIAFSSPPKSRSGDFFCLKTDDIEGCSPSKSRVGKEIRKTNDVSDIEGSHAGSRKQFKSSRHTNPLNPKYEVRPKTVPVEM